MVANANFPQARDGRGYLDYYIPFGYIPLDVYAKGTCESLMYAYNDWAIGEVATILGRTEDAPIYAARALNYKNSFSTEDLFMCPRYLVPRPCTLRLVPRAPPTGADPAGGRSWKKGIQTRADARTCTHVHAPARTRTNTHASLERDLLLPALRPEPVQHVLRRRQRLVRPAARPARAFRPHG